MMNLAKSEYKPGSPEDILLRNLKSTLKRNAAGKCSACGKHSNSPLEAHHILPRHINPESSVDPRNIVIICSACHKRLHSGLVKHSKIVEAQVRGMKARLTGERNYLNIPDIEWITAKPLESKSIREPQRRRCCGAVIN
jgi:hypothetical protein